MRSSFDRTYPTTKCLQLSQDSASFGALDAFFLCAVARKGDKEHGTIEVKICRSVDQKSLLFRVLVDRVVALFTRTISCMNTPLPVASEPLIKLCLSSVPRLDPTARRALFSLIPGARAIEAL